MSSEKNYAVFLRLDAAEYERLQKLAQRLGLNAQNAIRVLLKSEADAIMGLHRQGAR